LNTDNAFKSKYKTHNDGNYTFVRVFSVDSIPKTTRKVYDLTVENSHSYMVNNVIVHNSAVSFFTNLCLGFTAVDRISSPVKMYPDRFMSATRILESGSLPDIDFNVAPVQPFADAQQQVLGEDHAYPMVAYGTMQTSAAWKLYAKSQNVPFETANQVSEQIKKYEAAVKHADEDDKDEIDVYDYIENFYKDIFDKSKDYRGVIVSWSIAPCSYLLYNGSIREQIGLVKVKDHLCCAIDGHWAEAGHFLKNDILKVSVVDLIYRSYKRIGMEPPSVDELLKMCPPEDDAWKMYAKACTVGLNQVENTGTSSRVAVYKPTNISELSAFVAAIRPGFKSMYKTFESRKPFKYNIKAFDDLIQTKEMPNSFVLYQEQEMAALHYAGIPMSDCYTAIKNIAKKRAEKVMAYKETFISGFSKSIIEDEGKSEEEANNLAHQLWQIIEDSSRYSFNACVSGDTVIDRPGLRKDQFCPNVSEMYEILNDPSSEISQNHKDLYKKYKRLGFGSAFSMFDDNRIHKNKIIDIRESGEQKVFTLSLKNGASINCTENHKFPTPEGIRYLSELSTGDMLYTRGEYEVNRDPHCLTDGNFKNNFPVKGQQGFQKRSDGDSVIFEQYRKEHIEQKCPCQKCGIAYSDNLRFEVHHKDQDRSHNSYDNYEWLCVSCHKKAHYSSEKLPRNKQYEKGIPTVLDEIVGIEYKGTEMTYDVEMAAPAHNFVTSTGIVTCNSHSVSVGLDSLYSAWIKAHHPCEFYETLLLISEEKGDKDKMIAAKEEAESYFNIKFPPYRFGQDNRSIKANSEKNEIVNSLSAIKGYSKTASRLLYDCSKQGFKHFFDIVKWLGKRSFKSAKIIPLIKIDYFADFGNSKELMELISVWDFLNEGEAKKVKKDSAEGWIGPIIEKYASGLTSKGADAKSWTITDMPGLLEECESYIRGLNIPDLDYKTKAANQNEILGYVDLTTGKEEDRRKLLILDVFPLPDRFNGGIWKYKVKTKSIGSGKTALLDVTPNLMDRYKLSKNDIIFVKDTDIKKDKKGYWQMYSYSKIIE
jgi:hypothetical protein